MTKSTEGGKKQPQLRTMTKTVIKKKKIKGSMGTEKKAVKRLKNKELKGTKKKELKSINKKEVTEKKAITGVNKKKASTVVKKKLKQQIGEKTDPCPLLVDMNDDEYFEKVPEVISEKEAGAQGDDELTPPKKKLTSKKAGGKKMKKKSHGEVSTNSFFIDMKGNSKPGKRRKSRGIECENGMKMGYEEIKEKERNLVFDLFGDSGEVAEDDEEAVAPVVFQKRLKTSKKLKKDEVADSNIPEDPYDIHHVEVSEPERKPAWVDEDDVNIRVMDVAASMTKFRGQRGIRETSDKKYEVELRDKFSQVVGSTPDWAELNYKPKEDSDDDEMVRSTGNYLSGESSFNLPKLSLEYKQMNDLNSSHTEGAFIQAIEFNPNLQVGLVAGSLKSLGAASLFQVDGKANHRIHSVRFPGYPITCARFMRDGKKFVVGSNMYNHFFVYDMETSKETKIYVNRKFEKGIKKNLYVSPDGELLIFLGNKGKIYIYDTATLSLIDKMEAPHTLTSATFNADGSRMYTHGVTGEVCVWDMLARECVHKFYDEGCIAGDVLAMSPNNQYLACGSRSGIVNVYDSAGLSTSSPTPVKVLSNLTTAITALTFNASSEILAMTSNHLANALKLVHFPSMTIFENFPKPGSIMKRSEVLQFSPQSGYFAVGNFAGTAALYRLKHFSSY